MAGNQVAATHLSSELLSVEVSAAWPTPPSPKAPFAAVAPSQLHRVVRRQRVATGLDTIVEEDAVWGSEVEDLCFVPASRSSSPSPYPSRDGSFIS
ncbi:hypothetical protein HPP92_011846 [Vanilla planifolia]|uniref:Uncharacterized protein n=1 Tax=Vanilla planifolia TaxID=51239 RepID=A0A835RD59_VANPL|nr:hypothetical protein HPP92_011846 [Vanilla planifolia]